MGRNLRPRIVYLPDTEIPLYWKAKNLYVLKDLREIERLLPRLNFYLEMKETDLAQYNELGFGVTRCDGSRGMTFIEYENCNFFFYCRKQMDRPLIPIELEDIKRVEVTIL